MDFNKFNAFKNYVDYILNKILVIINQLLRL
jgi:hypothetical protein